MKQAFKSEPFLWIHLSGIGVFPIALLFVWLGLSVGVTPSVYWLELLMLVGVGIVPLLWMQWNRPFDIFSILVLSVQPQGLTPQQRQILSSFKSTTEKVLATFVAVVMAVILFQLYKWAPIAAQANPFVQQPRILGVLVAAVAFFIANLFLQVPVSVMGLLLMKEEKFKAIEPLTPEAIAEGFLIPGWRVNKIPLLSALAHKVESESGSTSENSSIEL